jgi:hypothetical protein
MVCRPVVVYLLNCILEATKVTEGRKYFPRGPRARGSQRMLCGSPGIRDHFLRDPWIRFCNGYFEVSLYFKLNECFVKTNRGTCIIGDVSISYDR